MEPFQTGECQSNIPIIYKKPHQIRECNIVVEQESLNHDKPKKTIEGRKMEEI